MFGNLGRSAGRIATDLRPRWAWIALALGLPWILTPLSCKASALGCLGVLSALCFWVAAAVLGYLGLRWLWRKILFRVSRRLWVILILLSILPVAALTVFFLSAGWAALGGQTSRTLLGNLQNLESAMKIAIQEPQDRDATHGIKALGQARLQRVPGLPPDMDPKFAGLVYDPKAPGGTRGLYILASAPADSGFRILSLNLDALADQDLRLLGGQLHLRLDRGEEGTPEVKKGIKITPPESEEESTNLDSPALSGPREPVMEWSVGQPLAGRYLFKSFRLPPVGLRVVDWASGRPMLLTVVPETNLKVVLAGHGFSKGNLSSDSILKMAQVALLLLVLCLVQAIALLMGLVMSRQLGESVHGLFKGVARLSAGDFSVRIRPRGHDEVSRLTQAFNLMAGHLESAAVEHDERLRLEEELRVAREVQMRLLPDVSGLAPAIQATILPAREVAGDYFDLFRLPDGRIAFLIADVSGKGTSAAFYAAETKGVLAALDKTALGPVEVMDRLNSIWCAGHPRSLFLTAIYGRFNPVDGTFGFVRAGHPPALLRRADGSVERLAPRGLGIGMAQEGFASHLELCEGRLEAGEAILFFTDGLSEAMNPQDELFGDTRLEALLAELVPGELSARVLAGAQAFAEGRPLEDDLTLLVLQR